jgi:hypothetical protein
VRRACERTASPVVFCHNDVTPGNVLFDRAAHVAGDRGVHLIDFEYASYSFRGCALPLTSALCLPLGVCAKLWWKQRECARLSARTACTCTAVLLTLFRHPLIPLLRRGNLPWLWPAVPVCFEGA